jgi:LmbE family N-acetylglucosaminyl deacetylase
VKIEKQKNCVVIVAHPDDETLWAGGMILTHPHWNWFIIGLCRKHDADRAPRFYNALKALKAEGILGDLDDSPDLVTLDEQEVNQAIQDLLPEQSIDLVLTHNPDGEYTRHIRHEEIGKSVIQLWQAGKIKTKKLLVFAYEDNMRKYFPKPIKTASIYTELSKPIWLQKYSIVTDTYGFGKESWEEKTTPTAEAFWQFENSEFAGKWLVNKLGASPEA